MTFYETTQVSRETLLERASLECAIRIQRANGQVFVLRPELPQKSPFDVPGVNLNLNAQQIVEFVHAGRREQSLEVDHDVKE
jgi:hypothetical protein